MAVTRAFVMYQKSRACSDDGPTRNYDALNLRASSANLTLRASQQRPSHMHLRRVGNCADRNGDDRSSSCDASEIMRIAVVTVTAT